MARKQKVVRVEIEQKGKKPESEKVCKLIAGFLDIALESGATYKEICEACKEFPSFVASMSRPIWADPLKPRD